MDEVARKGDAAIIVCQNNAKRTVNIDDITEEAAAMLGYPAVELTGVPLQHVLGDAIVEAIEDYLEFEDSAQDLDEVLSRVRSFKLKAKDGALLPVDIKIDRTEARDAHHWFRLVVLDEREEREKDSMREMLQSNLEGRMVLDDVTGLPDRYSAEQAVELLNNYINSHKMKACFAMLRVDRHESNVEHYGKRQCLELLKHAGNCCRSKLRSDDIVCRVGDNLLAVLLMDITPESARVVLNRLRWFIHQHRIVFGGKSDFSVTISIGFMPMAGESASDLLGIGEDAMGALDSDERNKLIDLS